MDDRQTQLVTAAQAMRTWIHAQRAMWAEGYPQSLSRAPSQFAAATPGAFALPSTALPHADSAPADIWVEADGAPPFSGRLAERVGSSVQATATFIQRSWRPLSAIAVAAVAVFAVRVAWPDVKEVKERVSASQAVERPVVKIQKEVSPERVTGLRSRGSTTGPLAGVKGTGRLQVDSSPTGAQVLVDGKERGVTPLTVDGLAVGSHKIMIRGDEGSVQRTVSITSAEVVQLNEPIYSGWLHVSAPFDIQISEGRKSIILDDSNQVLLPPGPHDVLFLNRAVGLREVRHLDISPGETTAVSLETPVSHLTVTASEPATVSIDGVQAGETPLTDYSIAVGTRDVTITSASGQVRRRTITVKVRATQIDVDFSKP